ncbi:unnamed protein product, partial [Lymnaea stagnalis]
YKYISYILKITKAYCDRDARGDIATIFLEKHGVSGMLLQHMAYTEEIYPMMGCVINVKSKFLKERPSGSAVILNPKLGIIISHGTLLAELVTTNHTLKSNIIDGKFIKKKALKETVFEVLIDKQWKPQHSTNQQPLDVNNTSQKAYQSASNFDTVTSACFTTLHCKFMGAFKNIDFHKAVSSMMPNSNWTFDAGQPGDVTIDSQSSSNQESSTENSKVYFNLLSYFIFFQTVPLILQESNAFNFFRNVNAPPIKKFPCGIGDVAEIMATPFGNQNPSVFFNTFSRGVISNVNGPGGCWILTDARCIPGSEGGPLYTKKVNQTRLLTGVVVASLCWKNKEWVGFSLCCSLASIFHSILKLKNMNLFGRAVQDLSDIDSQLRYTSRFNTGKQNSLLATTLLVKVGGTWGSGVVINKELGIILTCNHVIKDSKQHSVIVKPFQGSKEYLAHVIFCHQKLHDPYDIAVLKCPQATSLIPGNKVPNICSPKLGEKAWVVGHALFSSDLDLHPSVSSGIVSKVISIESEIVMIQSTCAVHPGASGGPLLNDHGDLIGILVCNTIDKGSNSCYPHLNMSIPACSLLPAIDHYLQKGDTSDFSILLKKDLVIKKLWA